MGGTDADGGGASTPRALSVDVFTEGDEVRVVVEGGLDRLTRHALYEAVWSAAAGGADFVLDLRGVTDVDEAGAQGLLELTRIGVVRRVANVPPAVRARVGDTLG